MRDIGARLGPFDVTMIEVGQYHRAWPDLAHRPPSRRVAHGMVRRPAYGADALGLFSWRRTAGPSRSSALWPRAARRARPS
jgi:hypothetical protein